MDKEQVEALKAWMDEGKAPDDFRRVNGWSKESFEELLTAAMSPAATVTKVATPTLVVEDDDE
tara:strand:+ start:372 stop:560 length:189 start_codon:yes stop_codon:yes gene_type:complete